MKKVLFYLSVFCFSFFQGVGQDFQNIKDEATLLGSTRYWCSFPDDYSTTELTGNQPQSSCYDKLFVYGKWFKFQATESLAEIKVKIGGEAGTMLWPRVSLWDENLTELGCKNSIDDTTNISLDYTEYKIGKWYYISVNHNNHPKYVGSFVLCITSELNNDSKDAATFIRNTSKWSSAKGEFSTNSATPDGKKPSCMNSGPNFNKWFQFIAKSNVASIEVKSGGKFGTMKNPYVTLFDSEMNEIACDKYVDNVECKINTDQLKIGETYFISVDHSMNETYKGSFTLLIDNGSVPNENVLLKITDFNETDLIKITGKLMYDINTPRDGAKVWLLNDKNIELASTLSDVNGEFEFENLPPNQNFLVMIEDDKKDIKVDIFQTNSNGDIIKKTIRLDKVKYGFDDLPLLCNKIILIDCSSNFDIKNRTR